MFQCQFYYACEHVCSFLWLGVKGNPPGAWRTDSIYPTRTMCLSGMSINCLNVTYAERCNGQKRGR